MNPQTGIIPAGEWAVLTQQADALVKSGFLPQSIKTVQQAIAIITLGRELGIPPWAALSTINVIQGKPTVSPQLMLALINRSGQLADMECLSTPTECTVTMVRRGRVPHAETFSMKDAAALQLTGKDNYKKQPATMLKWRAVAACARVVFPDVILGLYTPDEMGAQVKVDDDGNMEIIDVSPGAPEKLAPPPSTQSTSTFTATTPHVGGQNAIPATSVPNGSASSTPGGSANGAGSPDKLAQAFPAASKWDGASLYAKTQDYFRDPKHFDHHWNKHIADYAGKTLEEAASYVRDLHWNFDKDKCATLRAFGTDGLALTSNAILAALAEANGHSVKGWKDWDGGNFAVAHGALVAWKCDYDEGRIMELEQTKRLSKAMVDAALDIAEAYRQKHPKEVTA